ncbi:hypothetical protein F0L68_12320 [Solihabitans fulvus]|uniref:Uncharacterized protein n=1 Tax=Solihabitans fulvus TaxID=1892852 RepID=A0A5B2XHM3_9PSEU|nr:hypothetical protein [Solihabitans fulvus]KAA2262674.1 hypothetical protein F0L68_12320 [Solihabitans fulvus]
MEPALSSVLVTLAGCVALVALSLFYLRRWRIERPPIGVVNLRDIVIMSVVLVLIPPLYLRLPSFGVIAVLALVFTVVLSTVLRPVLGQKASWLVALALVGVEIAHRSLALNDVLVLLVLIGAANLWVQSGMRARDVAVFAAGLTVYDALATLVFPTMVDFFGKLATLPLTPVLGWGSGSAGMAVGMGDLLVVVLWTLTLTKSRSLAAGLVGGALGLTALAALMLVLYLGWVNRGLPAMILLGPLILVQYAVLRRRPERTWAEYAGTPPVPLPVVDPSPALKLLHGSTGYLALCGDEVVATAPTAAEAARLARGVRPGQEPLLVLSSEPPPH